jgi:hypothetical protein
VNATSNNMRELLRVLWMTNLGTQFEIVLKLTKLKKKEHLEGGNITNKSLIRYLRAFEFLFLQVATRDHSLQGMAVSTICLTGLPLPIRFEKI